MKETGIIKFKCTWIKDSPLPFESIEKLTGWRDKLYSLGLIGAYENGVGFGNISIRFKENQIIISGSATGGISKLNEQHYTLVTHYDIAQNTLTAVGPIIASSESLTHAVIYENSSITNAVIHIHHPALWNKLLDNVPTTQKDFTYGTPELAQEIGRLFTESTLEQDKILVMGGHEDGIISFGKNLDEAGEILLSRFNELVH